MKTSFVVLHYENQADTELCLDSLIESFAGEDYSVVVVDNGSVKETISPIEVKYSQYDYIHFIYSSENLGFAKGNNLGFMYAKEKLNAEIIILCNNDLLFCQKEFLINLYKHYEADRFDIAGPKTISLVDGMNQNPVPVLYDTRRKLEIRILKYKILLLLNIVNLDGYFKNKFAKKIEEYNPKEDDDYQLFGACLIFTSRYIKMFDGLYAGTFMYNEESILKERAEQYHLVMKYYDDIEVKHKEGASTTNVYGLGKKKRRFYYYWNLRSCYLLRKIRTGKERI